MVARWMLLLVVVTASSCVGPRTLYGVAWVQTADSLYQLRNAEVWIFSGQDTLRQTVDPFGRFRFEKVKRRAWFLSGYHPRCTPPDAKAINWDKNPRLGVWGLNFYDRGIEARDTSARPYPLFGTKNVHPPLSKLRLRQVMPRRWVMTGRVFDRRLRQYAAPNEPCGVADATVCFVRDGGDTLRVRTDREGRYFITGLRGAEYRAWAEKEGYHASPQIPVRPFYETPESDSLPNQPRVYSRAFVPFGITPRRP